MSLLVLKEAGGRTRIGFFVDLDADVVVLADVLLLFMVPPVLFGRFRRPAIQIIIMENNQLIIMIPFLNKLLIDFVLKNQFLGIFCLKN